MEVLVNRLSQKWGQVQGFRRAWQQMAYPEILNVARKIPEDVLQEDPMLLMSYTNTLTRTGELA